MVENMTELKPDICVTAGEQGLVAWLLKRLRVSMLYNTIQYNTIQYNTMQCNAMQCNAMQYITAWCSIIKYITT